jgi:hypothetical protein
MPRPLNTDFRMYQNAGLVGVIAVSKAAEHWVEENVISRSSDITRKTCSTCSTGRVSMCPLE